MRTRCAHHAWRINPFEIVGKVLDRVSEAALGMNTGKDRLGVVRHLHVGELVFAVECVKVNAFWLGAAPWVEHVEVLLRFCSLIQKSSAYLSSQVLLCLILASIE